MGPCEEKGPPALKMSGLLRGGREPLSNTFHLLGGIFVLPSSGHILDLPLFLLNIFFVCLQMQFISESDRPLFIYAEATEHCELPMLPSSLPHPCSLSWWAWKLEGIKGYCYNCYNKAIVILVL